MAVTNHYHAAYAGGNFRYRFHWDGGIYFDVPYAPGWYYSGYLYPDVWYWGPGWGYRYEVKPYLGRSGIKFDLDRLKGKEKDAVANAGVYLPNKEEKEGYLGRVKNFSGFAHSSLPLKPGTYDLTIALTDGRRIPVSITVQEQRVTHVALTFDQPGDVENGQADNDRDADRPRLRDANPR